MVQIGFNKLELFFLQTYNRFRYSAVCSIYNKKYIKSTYEIVTRNKKEIYMIGLKKQKEVVTSRSCILK